MTTACTARENATLSAARDPGDVTRVELLAGARAFLDACRGL
jgi:hypothetical protein